MSVEQDLLKAILATTARQVFPPDVLTKLVISKVGGAKQLAAFNLCNGSHTQAQIGKVTGIDKGNLSKSISRWIDLGIVVRLGSGNDAKPMHVYPLTSDHVKKKGKKNGD